MMEEYEIDYEGKCTKCGHSPTHYRDCTEFDCEEGLVEEFFDDIEIPGTGDIVTCRECKGTGIESWCPKCGENLSGFGKDEDDEL